MKDVYKNKLKLVNLPGGLSRAIEKCPLIIGVGPSAWPRIISSFYFPKYKIFSYYDCQDNDFIKDFGVDVLVLKEKNPYLEISPVTPGRILSSSIAKEYIAKLNEPFAFLVYKSSYILEKVCRENNWKFLNNRKDLVDRFENKKIFKETLKNIGVETIPGENIKIEELTKGRFENFQKLLGQKKLVLQLAEMTYGGGSGTLFVESSNQLDGFFERVTEVRKNLEGKKKKIETVNVAPFIEGASASITCCAGKYGIFAGTIQNQIVDITEVGTKIENRSGNYAGHDWAYVKYSENIQDQATKLARKFGDYLYQEGYKGIFGLDIIVDHYGKVWPVECNPRDTDVYPLISMLQMERGLIPMDVFHNLEHLGVDYQINFEEIDKGYKKGFDASQIIIHNRINRNVIDRKVFKAGVYNFDKEMLNYQRQGFLLSDLKNDKEYLFCEGILKKPGRTYTPNSRILRMIKRGGILKNESTLLPDVNEVIKDVYKDLKLMPVEDGLINNNGLKVIYANKLLDIEAISKPRFKLGFESPSGACSIPVQRVLKWAVDKYELAKNIDMVNIISETKDGFRRPLKISWRKELNKGPILDQIRSKRAKKQIISDIKKIKNLGIEIKIYPEIYNKIFCEWLTLYRKIIGSKEKGQLILSDDWLDKKSKTGKKVGAVVAYRSERIIGGNIFFEVKERLSVGYGVAERVSELKGGLGLLLDYYFMEHAQKLGFSEISFGQDTNLYGYDLSCGLLAYKVKLGLKPYPANKTYWVNSYFLNFEKFDDPIMFISGDEKNLELVVLTENEKSIDTKVYLPEGIRKVNIYDWSKIQRLHHKLILA